MNIYKRIFATCFSILLFFSVFTFPVYSTSLDLTGGVIIKTGTTAFDFTEKTLYPDEVQAYIEYIEEHVKNWEYATITVKKDGKEYTLPMELKWDYQVLENPEFGETIGISGTIIPPNGCTFSDYVSNTLYYFIKIVPRPENVPDLNGGIVTYVNPDLGRFWRELLEQGEALTYFEETINMIEEHNEYIQVEKDGKIWAVPLTINWNYTQIDNERLGEYSLIGHVIAPEGCTFSPTVLKQISLPVKVLKLPEKIPLTVMRYSGPTDRPYNLFMEQNNVAALKTWQQELQYLGVACASEDGNFAVPLELIKLDTQAVLPNIPGIYPVTAYYKMEYQDYDRFMDRYLPSDDVLSTQLFVKVSDSSKFELWNTNNDSDYLRLHWVKETPKTPTILCTTSETELSEELLNNAQWKISPWLPDNDKDMALNLNAKSLKEDLHYYFRLEYEDETSNIAHIVYDGDVIQNEYIDHGGDRDGGGGDNNTLPPVSQPVPNEPPKDNPSMDDTITDDSIPDESTKDNTLNNEETNVRDDELQLESSNMNNHTTNIPFTKAPLSSNNSQKNLIEEDSATRSVWSGLRLNYAATLKNKVTFVKENITIQLNSDTLLSLGLSDSDLFSLEITQTDEKTVYISLKINDELIPGISNMQVQIPYQPQDSQATFHVVQASDNSLLDAEFKDKNIHFTTDKAGLFTIQEETEKQSNAVQNNEKQVQKNYPYSTIILIALLILLPISILLWRKRK